jgi:hypothetical protein
VINPYESRWFWIVLVANPAVWVLLSLSALLGLDWGERRCRLACLLAVHWVRSSGFTATVLQSNRTVNGSVTLGKLGVMAHGQKQHHKEQQQLVWCWTGPTAVVHCPRAEGQLGMAAMHTPIPVLSLSLQVTSLRISHSACLLTACLPG